MLNAAIFCWPQSARYKRNIRFSGWKWDISGPCGRFLKICDQQCVGGPPWSITRYRLSVWQEWSWEPLCLNPRQTVLGNREIKGEPLIPKTSLATFLSLLQGLKCPHHHWATHDSERKKLVVALYEKLLLSMNYPLPFDPHSSSQVDIC